MIDLSTQIQEGIEKADQLRLLEALSHLNTLVMDEAYGIEYGPTESDIIEAIREVESLSAKTILPW
jgi:hypothetical protein